MIKKLFVLFLLITLASCSMFFDREKTDRDGIGINALALSDGSGYISTDEYNEITPFVFSDTNTGKKWLFFASDRGGSYDIYYAEMDSEGKFSHPVKMDVAVNTSDGEFSPVVFYGIYNDYSMTGLFISFLRGAGQLTNLETVLLNPDFSMNSNIGGITSHSYGKISIIKRESSLYLLIASGNNSWMEYSWNIDDSANWYDSEYMTYTLSNMNDPVYSINGYAISESYYTTNWYIFSVMKNGKHQIFAGADNNVDYSQCFFPVKPYESTYNDKDPIIDGDDQKVYFASDRYGKGNYDLYRYNLVRYDAVKPVLLSAPEVSLDYFYPSPPQMSWTAVPGATHYKVFRYVSTDEMYSEIADITGLSFTDTNVSFGYTYDYIIQAVNNMGVSGFSIGVGGSFGTQPW